MFNKIKQKQRKLSTYHIGLLQTKAYRVLNAKATVALKPHGISSIEWALLGVLYEASFESKDGVKATALAKCLGVEGPFVTELVGKLEKKNLVSTQKSQSDKRVRFIRLTSSGNSFVPTVEKGMYKESKTWISGLGLRDVISYVRVIGKLAELE